MAKMNPDTVTMLKSDHEALLEARVERDRLREEKKQALSAALEIIGSWEDRTEKAEAENARLRKPLEMLAVRRLGGATKSPQIICALCLGPITNTNHLYMSSESLVSLLKHNVDCIITQAALSSKEPE